MARYAAGDASAFEELYDQLAPRLFAFLLRKVGDRARTEDLLQQSMLQMHLARGRFVPGSRVAPWAFAIAHRLFLDSARRKKLEILSPDGDAAPDFAHQGPGPATVVETRELDSLLRAHLQRLSSAQREAFELVHYGQLSHAEAAETLGVSLASVKLRLQRANITLRAALGSVLHEVSES